MPWPARYITRELGEIEKKERLTMNAIHIGLGQFVDGQEGIFDQPTPRLT